MKTSFIERAVYCKFQVEGFHSFKDADEEVAFLRNEHRHIFYFKVSIQVNHNDRDIEFISMKRKLEKYFSQPDNINNKSCEMLAMDALGYLNTIYPDRDMAAEVSEDGENGAIVMVHRNAAAAILG